MGRTVRDFATSLPVWTIVDPWAAASGYRVVEQTATGKRYELGGGFTAKSMLIIENPPGQVHLEAWVPADAMQRLFTLYLLPAEMEIDSNRSGQTIARKMARTAVNKLLQQFSQPPIP